MSDPTDKPYFLIGIGNFNRRDDGVGPYVARNFSDPQWYCLDAGMVPESFTSVIKKHKPQTVVIVDAAEMGLSGGSVRRVLPESIDALGIGTHSMPLSFFYKYLAANLSAEVIVLGVQPVEICDGLGLSPVVQSAAKSIIEMLGEKGWDGIETLKPAAAFC